jgi:hypothetical protein
MSFKLTPITAVIQKTTKGGVTQPFIKGIGSAFPKMKEDAVGKLKVSEKILNKNRANSKSSDSSVPNKPRKNSRQDLINKRKELKSNKPQNGYKPGEGVLKNDTAPKNNTNNSTPSFEIDYGSNGAIENKKPSKNTKITGKIGSDLRRKQYDAKGWAYDDTIKKPKTGVSTKLKSEGTKDLSTKTEVVKPKKQETTKEAVKKAGKKLDSADRKDSRAAKVRQKGIDALASGDTKKANRLKRRETRIKNRADKKRGQASKAIDPNN